MSQLYTSNMQSCYFNYCFKLHCFNGQFNVSFNSSSYKKYFLHRSLMSSFEFVYFSDKNHPLLFPLDECKQGGGFNQTGSQQTDLVVVTGTWPFLLYNWSTIIPIHTQFLLTFYRHLIKWCRDTRRCKFYINNKYAFFGNPYWL